MNATENRSALQIFFLATGGTNEGRGNEHLLLSLQQRTNILPMSSTKSKSEKKRSVDWLLHQKVAMADGTRRLGFLPLDIRRPNKSKPDSLAV